MGGRTYGTAEKGKTARVSCRERAQNYASARRQLPQSAPRRIRKNLKIPHTLYNGPYTARTHASYLQFPSFPHLSPSQTYHLSLTFYFLRISIRTGFDIFSSFRTTGPNFRLLLAPPTPPMTRVRRGAAAFTRNLGTLFFCQLHDRNAELTASFIFVLAFTSSFSDAVPA